MRGTADVAGHDRAWSELPQRPQATRTWLRTLSDRPPGAAAYHIMPSISLADLSVPAGRVLVRAMYNLAHIVEDYDCPFIGAGTPPSGKLGAGMPPGTPASVTLYDNRLFTEEQGKHRRPAARSTGGIKAHQPPSARPPQAPQPRRSQHRLSFSDAAISMASLSTTSQNPQPRRSQHRLSFTEPAAAAAASPAAHSHDALNRFGSLELPPRPMSPGRVLGLAMQPGGRERLSRSGSAAPPATSSAPDSRPSTASGRMQQQLARNQERRRERLQVSHPPCVHGNRMPDMSAGTQDHAS